MNLTLGFIAFFISIIIPGILFRRFFFYGEFSKQFNTKDPVIHSIFFSIIPGIVIQLFCSVFYNFLIGTKTTFFDIFTVFKDFTSDTFENETTKNFIKNDLTTFLSYIICVFVFSAFIGFLSSRIIRIFKWDLKYKLFRFKNQWYYIFSGEVLNMKKFKETQRFSLNKNKNFEQDTFLTYADILLYVGSDDKKELYTGYVADYELLSEDITQLDKIYLIDTHRYKKKDIRYNEKENEIIELDKENTSKSRNRIKVPGDVFILDAKKIVNINLTYIPSNHKIEDKKKKYIDRKQRFFKYLQGFYFSLFLLVILSHFVYEYLPIKNYSYLYNYFYSISSWGKIISVIFINQILSIIIPLDENNKKLQFDIKQIILKLVFLIFWGLFFYFFVITKLK